jgi:hypothetical protein
VLLPSERRLDILALTRDARPMRSLLALLRRNGCDVDVVADLEAACGAFCGVGGHQILLVGPDVPEAVAQQVVRALRQVDPGLPAASFGPRWSACPGPAPNAVLAGLHPSSRAGAGALLRWMRGLRERS